VSSVLAYIAQHRWRGVNVIKDRVKQSVTIQIGYGNSARRNRDCETAAGSCAHALESTRAQIAQQQWLLGVARSPLVLIDGGIDVAVRNYDVLPPIVVVVHETCAPSQETEV